MNKTMTTTVGNGISKKTVYDASQAFGAMQNEIVKNAPAGIVRVWLSGFGKLELHVTVRRSFHAEAEMVISADRVRIFGNDDVTVYGNAEWQVSMARGDSNSRESVLASHALNGEMIELAARLTNWFNQECGMVANLAEWNGEIAEHDTELAVSRVFVTGSLF